MKLPRRESSNLPRPASAIPICFASGRWKLSARVPFSPLRRMVRRRLRCTGERRSCRPHPQGTPQDCPRMERCTFHRALLITTPLFYPVPTPAEDCEYSNKHRDYRSARARRDSVQEACCWRSRRHVYRCRNAKRDVAHPCLDRGGWLGLTAQVKCFLLDPECVTYMGCFGKGCSQGAP
jgi:hypothetical protein